MEYSGVGVMVVVVVSGLVSNFTEHNYKVTLARRYLFLL